MSKKYVLVVKEEYYGRNYFPKPIDRAQLTMNNSCKYNNVTTSISSEPSFLTQEEINELPYGFVKMFNIFEVEDTKYYWRKKKEHLCSFETEQSYLNYDCEAECLFLEEKHEEYEFKTKLTESEAKELLGDDFDMFERVDIE